MKKIIIAIALILLTGITFGQSLKKANLVGMHVMDINLDPDVTMNEFLDFMQTKYLPEVEKMTRGGKRI